MSLHRSDPTLRERAIELLADRAIFGLDGESTLELDRLLLACPDVDESALDLAAAALEPLALAITSRSSAGVTNGRSHAAAIPLQMPAALRERLVDSGEAWVRAHAPEFPVARVEGPAKSEADAGAARPIREDHGRDRSRPEGPRPEGAGALPLFASERSRVVGPALRPVGEASGAGAAFGVLTIGGWLAAAAALVFAVSAWLPNFAKRQTPEGARAELIAKAPDLMRIEWSTPGHANVDDFLCGDVVWSNELQRGFMAITGLRPNDPSEFQYQLWIFDKTRNEMHPIDGGVFDVPASEKISMAVIPINAKLAVREPTLFAVTIEPPGGVVVSDRDIAILAAVK